MFTWLETEPEVEKVKKKSLLLNSNLRKSLVSSHFKSGLQKAPASKVPPSQRFSLIPAEYFDQDATADENLRTNIAANRLPVGGWLQRPNANDMLIAHTHPGDAYLHITISDHRNTVPKKEFW